MPQTYLSLLLTYCHSCMAWTRHMTCATQSGEADPEVVSQGSLGYGPFDSAAVVLDDALDTLIGQFYAPGRPWDQGPLARMELTRLTPPAPSD